MLGSTPLASDDRKGGVFFLLGDVDFRALIVPQGGVHSSLCEFQLPSSLKAIYPTHLPFPHTFNHYEHNVTILFWFLPIHRCVLKHCITQYFPESCEQNHRHVDRVGFELTTLAVIEHRLPTTEVTR